MASKTLINRDHKLASKRRSSKPTVRETPPVSQRIDPATVIQRASFEPQGTPAHDVLQLQRAIGNQAVQGLLQPKLAINKPGDKYEQEADRLADRVMRMSDEEVKRKPDVGVSGPARIESGSTGSSGQPLSDSARSYFEPRFGEDFSQVRLHTDERAAKSAQKLGARAFTLGQNVVLGEGRYAPETVEGRELLAHELAHVVQQGNGESNKMIQRRLIATGTPMDIQSFIKLATAASGQKLSHDPKTNEITANASLRLPTVSPTFERLLTQIMDDPLQDAEVHFGTHQTAPTPGGGPATGVAIGLFPLPHDFTGSRVQLVDMDDILAVEAGAPGNGIAQLAHELDENYRAHAATPTPGVDLFTLAHSLAKTTENQVASELVGPGDMVAQVSFPAGTNIIRTVDDFENYYLVSTLTQNPTTQDVTFSNVHRAAKQAVSTRTIDHFQTNSDVVPGTGAATLAQVVADLTTHQDATVLIEGFTDNVGAPMVNDDLSERRAIETRQALAALGINPGRIHIVGLGESNFVVPNNSDANRALNRRVVIRVTRPT